MEEIFFLYGTFEAFHGQCIRPPVNHFFQMGPPSLRPFPCPLPRHLRPPLSRLSHWRHHREATARPIASGKQRRGQVTSGLLCPSSFLIDDDDIEVHERVVSCRPVGGGCGTDCSFSSSIAFTSFLLLP